MIRVENMGETESGQKIPLYVRQQGFGNDDDTLVTDKRQATVFPRFPLAHNWLERRPSLARQAKVVHSLTGMEVWP